MTAQEDQIAPPPARPDGLLLDSLRIQGFRCFRDLQIPRLGRVNLIVGKNNVGKTALLEALRLYASNGSPSTIWSLLEDRNEAEAFYERSYLRDNAKIEERVLALKYLFYQRTDIRDRVMPIRIGPDNLTLNINVLSAKDSTGLISRSLDVTSPGRGTMYPISDWNSDVRTFSNLDILNYPYKYIDAQGLSNRESARLWDSIILTSEEDEIVEALRIILKRTQRVNFIEQYSAESDTRAPIMQRIPVVKLEELNQAIPLRSLGEGMSRMLGIGLALVSSRDGLLLVDEIDTGLHYTALPDVWRLVFATARRLNVQVFATTHSWDCIEAFTKAAIEDEQSEGMIISLRQKPNGEDIQAVLFDEEDLEIVTSEQIEIR